MRNQQVRLLASKQTLIRNNHLFIQRSTHWNAVQVNGTYKHTQHSNLCKDYSREGKQWHRISRAQRTMTFGWVQTIRYHVSDFEGQYQSHIQKRNPWWMWGTKVYQIIQWNKHRCLCTPDDYCSILSIEYMGAYKVRECVMNKLTTMPRNGILFLNVRTHECVNECKYGHD